MIPCASRYKYAIMFPIAFAFWSFSTFLFISPSFFLLHLNRTNTLFFSRQPLQTRFSHGCWMGYLYFTQLHFSVFVNDFVHFFVVSSPAAELWVTRAFRIIDVYMTVFKISKPSTNLCFRRSRVTTTSFQTLLTVKGIFSHRETTFNNNNKWEFCIVSNIRKVAALKVTIRRSWDFDAYHFKVGVIHNLYGSCDWRVIEWCLFIQNRYVLCTSYLYNPS